MYEQTDNIVYIKEDFCWHYAAMYLDGLLNSAVVQDEEFMRLYNQVKEYVDSKIFIPYQGEVVDFNVVVERKIK
ncbi:MAG: hypothetical protein NC037_04215 [Bacteroides sp.]|nr:hypothetical protein [Bacillota bacterium]MCM1394470.1 hypothetical protein [[Eubacterium] siraeum]MCM1455715.1 hypothetical protein [Bacteroides sp.]